MIFIRPKSKFKTKVLFTSIYSISADHGGFHKLGEPCKSVEAESDLRLGNRAWLAAAWRNVPKNLPFDGGIVMSS